jgi:hypothetical protein
MTCAETIRQIYLRISRPRPAPEKPDIVRYFEETDRDGLHRAAREHGAVHRALRLEMVLRLPNLDAETRREPLANFARELGMRVHPRPDRRSSEGEFGEVGLRFLDTLDAALDLPGIPPEFLPESYGSRILKMSSPRFDDIIKFGRLRFEGGFHPFERGKEVFFYPDQSREMDGGRDDVVRRLSAVHVVVRVDGLLRADLPAENLDRPVRDDLVRIHIRGSSAPGLENIHDEMLVMLPGDDLFGGPDDGVLQIAVEAAEFIVHLRGFEFHGSDGLYEAARKADSGYREIVEGASGLRPVKSLGRNFDLPHRVSFGALSCVLGHIRSPSGRL